MEWRIWKLLFFREFISQWVDLYHPLYAPGGFVLCGQHKDNKLLSNYTTIKSQDRIQLSMRADVFMNKTWQGIFRLPRMTFFPSFYIEKVGLWKRFGRQCVSGTLVRCCLYRQYKHLIVSVQAACNVTTSPFQFCILPYTVPVQAARNVTTRWLVSSPCGAIVRCLKAVVCVYCTSYISNSLYSARS